jgi:alpha-tubulin suppressor-like RCC1 family protein
MAITDKEQGVWGTDQVYNKIMEGDIWSYESTLNSFFITGQNEAGELGQNDIANRSSPVQIPGSWSKAFRGNSKSTMGLKSDNTLWVWGRNTYGQAAQNNETPGYSSPVQIPGTWSSAKGGAMAGGLKTDGTLWTWGFNNGGSLGQNQPGPGNSRSSPVQVPGTWSKFSSSGYSNHAIQTDGTLWAWGYNNQGQLGHNNYTQYSSPKQVPGSWDEISAGGQSVLSVKSDNTMWSWGNNSYGQLGLNEGTGNHKNSPVQIPGTTWKKEINEYGAGTHAAAIKTDGTLWTWGRNNKGQLGHNSESQYSSPKQVPGTIWQYVQTNGSTTLAQKTDGTLWGWGQNTDGELGLNNRTDRSSPVQIPGGYTLNNIDGTDGPGLSASVLLKLN